MEKIIPIIFLFGLMLCISIVSAEEATGVAANIANDIPTYTGLVPPDSIFYSLKLAVENVDEALTFNQTLKIQKKLEHAKLRISEAKRELKLNRADRANKALQKYREKVAEVGSDTEKAAETTGNKTVGLLRAQEMIQKHEAVLQGLLAENPNNVGLQRAINNTVVLNQKFTDKIAARNVSKSR